MASEMCTRRAARALATDALASLSDHLAVLDRDGTILDVNDAWNNFGVARGVQDVAAIGPGVNYLDACARSARSGVLAAARAREGIEAVCLGRSAAFEMEYQCDGPLEPAWFLMTVTPLRQANGGAVVSHRNITAWRDTRVARERVLSRLAGCKLRNLSGRLVTAQEDERRRIARELHDDVSQRLALLAIGLQQLIEVSHDAVIADRLHDLWVETTGISGCVHNLSHELHSSALGMLGLVPAIRSLSGGLLSKGLRVAVVANDGRIDLPQPAALCLFRVAQEALNNVLKHSGASEAVVTVKDTGGVVLLRVEDHGRGFDPRVQPGGLGLLSMRERVNLAGGELLVRARPGQGTVVDARLSRNVQQAASAAFVDLPRGA